MAHASHTPHPRRYVRSDCAVTWLMPDGGLTCDWVPADGPTPDLWLEVDAASAGADGADTGIGRSERFIGGSPHLR